MDVLEAVKQPVLEVFIRGDGPVPRLLGPGGESFEHFRLGGELLDAVFSALELAQLCSPLSLRWKNNARFRHLDENYVYLLHERLGEDAQVFMGLFEALVFENLENVLGSGGASHRVLRLADEHAEPVSSLLGLVGD